MPIKKVISDCRIPIKIWTDDVEATAETQLRNVANLPFVKAISVMPDVHTGFGVTIGSVVAMKDVVISQAVGVDIGCGVIAVRTPFAADAVKAKLPELKHSIERAIPTGFHEHSDAHDTDPYNQAYLNYRGGFQCHPHFSLHEKIEKALRQLGTLGGGNHFISVNIDQNNNVWYMIHSGSRHIGLSIANNYVKKAKELMDRWHITLVDPNLAYLPMGEVEFDHYMYDAQWAQDYAMANRKIMSDMVARQFAYILNDQKEWEPQMVINAHHNYVQREHHFGQDLLVTRKGAIEAKRDQWGIIPGSMGTNSYIVQGLGEPESMNSSSHGAGRRMSRRKARETFTMEDFAKQTEGNLCTNDKSVLDEIPGAYKSIEEVMANQVDLVNPIFTLKEIMTIKGAE